MVMRIVARGAWMGLGLALCLGALETGAADTTATKASKTANTTSNKSLKREVPPEAKAKREKVMQVEKVAKDFSAKRDSAYLNDARKRDKRRRDEEAAVKSPMEASSDAGAEDSIGAKK